MLKTKLVKAGFFGHGAVFLMVSPVTVNFSPLDLLNVNASKPLPVIYIQPDTTIFATDTVVLTPASFVAKAPCITISNTATAYVNKFIRQNREELEATEKRSKNYFRIIENVFAQYKLPAELKYLAVIESQLKPDALSHAGARGAWQLMPQTARDFGLKVSGKKDERTHFYKSTVASAKYLKGLHNMFGDWLLVIAAYNGGEGTVMKAIKKSGSRNFWKLQGFLPAETRSHVKRFIGAHYFFQAEGSLTVLTKAQTTAHLKAVEEYQEMINRQDQVTTISSGR